MYAIQNSQTREYVDVHPNQDVLQDVLNNSWSIQGQLLAKVNYDERYNKVIDDYVLQNIPPGIQLEHNAYWVMWRYSSKVYRYISTMLLDSPNINYLWFNDQLINDRNEQIPTIDNIDLNEREKRYLDFTIDHFLKPFRTNNHTYDVRSKLVPEVLAKSARKC